MGSAWPTSTPGRSRLGVVSRGDSIVDGRGRSTGGITSGGELDAGYAAISGGRLYVMLTGNIENNLNKVAAAADQTAAAAVTTGLAFSVALADIGNQASRQGRTRLSGRPSSEGVVAIFATTFPNSLR
jgi:hypothetical protein